MDLDEYLFTHKKTLAEIHRATGINRVTLSLIKRKKSIATLVHAIKIVAFTQGAVGFVDLLWGDKKEDVEKFLENYAPQKQENG